MIASGLASVAAVGSVLLADWLGCRGDVVGGKEAGPLAGSFNSLDVVNEVSGSDQKVTVESSCLSDVPG